MAVRDFNGTSDQLIIAPLGWPAAAPTGTLFAVYERDTTDSFERIHNARAAGSTEVHVFGLDSGGNAYCRVGAYEALGPSWTTAAGVWYFAAVAWTAGVARFHRRNLVTGTNEHGNHGFASGAGNPVAAVNLYVGWNGTSEGFDGRVATLGYHVGQAMSDGEFDAITGTAGLLSWSTTDANLYLADLNQAAVTTDVTDLSGNGRAQTGRTGTTVVNGDDPPNWTMDLGAATRTQRRTLTGVGA